MRYASDEHPFALAFAAGRAAQRTAVEALRRRGTSRRRRMEDAHTLVESADQMLTEAFDLWYIADMRYRDECIIALRLQTE